MPRPSPLAAPVTRIRRWAWLKLIESNSCELRCKHDKGAHSDYRAGGTQKHLDGGLFTCARNPLYLSQVTVVQQSPT